YASDRLRFRRGQPPARCRDRHHRLPRRPYGDRVPRQYLRPALVGRAARSLSQASPLSEHFPPSATSRNGPPGAMLPSIETFDAAPPGPGVAARGIGMNRVLTGGAVSAVALAAGCTPQPTTTATATPQYSAPQYQPPQPSAAVRDAQERLRAAGFYTGPIDGL